MRTSLVNIINTFGESTLDSIGYAMAVPDIALDGEMLAPGMIVELINGLAVVTQDAFETMNVTTLAEFNALEGTSDYLNAFSQLEDESIDALSGITIIRGMVSDALLNPDMQAFLVDTINTAQDLFVIDADFFNVDPILLDRFIELDVKPYNIQDKISFTLKIKAIRNPIYFYTRTLHFSEIGHLALSELMNG